MDETIIKCPACAVGVIEILQDQIEIAHFGELMISTLICPRCGYRSSDIVPLKSRPPRRYSIEVNSPETLNVRVVRSGSSTVRIPEIGARIDPGLFSDGYVTNIEGILRRFLDILFQILKDLMSNPKSVENDDRISRTREIITILEHTADGDLSPENRLTLVLEDPLGNSAIIAQDEDVIASEDLSEEEILEMLGSQSKRDMITEL
ncbi:MAG: ZPR1 zinc finger domain-containing protein, partial [Thermoplasmatota archaeon]